MIQIALKVQRIMNLYLSYCLRNANSKQSEAPIELSVQENLSGDHLCTILKSITLMTYIIVHAKNPFKFLVLPYWGSTFFLTQLLGIFSLFVICTFCSLKLAFVSKLSVLLVFACNILVKMFNFYLFDNVFFASGHLNQEKKKKLLNKFCNSKCWANF